MCRVKEIKLMVNSPEWPKVGINPEVKSDYEALVAEIDRLNGELGRRDKLIAAYKEALGGSVALREDAKIPEPDKNEGLLKRLKK